MSVPFCALSSTGAAGAMVVGDMAAKEREREDRRFGGKCIERKPVSLLYLPLT